MKSGWRVKRRWWCGERETGCCSCSWLLGKGHSLGVWEAQRMEAAEKKPMFLRYLLCAGPRSQHFHICATVITRKEKYFADWYLKIPSDLFKVTQRVSLASNLWQVRKRTKKAKTYS